MKKEDEVYKKHRPRKFKEIVGQEAAAEMLHRMVKKKKVPHFLLFTGPSGCGKTTLARIVARKLKCKSDFKEINGADIRGVDNIRQIRRQMMSVPLRGSCKVYLIDEAHKLTNEAQNASLKMLEDTPSHVYFMFATTEANKLLTTVRTRGTEVAVSYLTDSELMELINNMCEKEDIKVPKVVKEKIIFYSFGSARKALVLLYQISHLRKKKHMIEMISKTASEETATNIARALINPGTTWQKLCKELKSSIKEEPETIRWGVIMYARAVMINAASSRSIAARCFLIIDTFSDNFFYNKHAGLAAACYEVILDNKK